MKKMVKEVLLILVAVIVLITLSGCARVNYEVNVNKDGSADVVYIMGIEKESLNSMGYSEESMRTGMFDNLKTDAQKDGYQVEDYNDEQLLGFKASKHLDNISDFKINSSNESKDGENKEITFEKKLLDTTISQNSKVDLTNNTVDENTADENNKNLTSMSNMFLQQAKFSYKVTLPFKVGNNNATTVSEDGKTLEWTFKSGEVNDVYFEASENLNIILLGGICCLVVLVIVIIIIIRSKNKKVAEKEVKVSPKKTITNTEKKETAKIETKKEEANSDESKKAKTTKKKKEEKEEPKKDKE